MMMIEFMGHLLFTKNVFLNLHDIFHLLFTKSYKANVIIICIYQVRNMAQRDKVACPKPYNQKKMAWIFQFKEFNGVAQKLP